MARRHGFEGHRAQRMAKVAAIGAGTALALLAGAGCQLDPGNFGGYQFYTTPTPNQVSVIWVQDVHGATLEHWAFNNNTYGDTMGIDTVHKTGAGSMTEFKNKACATPVRSYIKVATTEYPLDCASPVKPTIPAKSVSVLGDGSYNVTQAGRTVGAVFVENRVEHWGVKTSEFDRDAGFSVRPRSGTPFTWRTWATYACTTFTPRTYWVVTAEDGGRLCP